MEEIVQNIMKENLETMELTCTCERCKADIIALSLNHLPPRYIVNASNRPYIRAQFMPNVQEGINILRVVLQAAEIVKKNKRCGN